MEDIYAKILNHPVSQAILNYILHLSPLEIKLLIVLVAVLALFLVYRLFGPGAAVGLSIIYFVAFIVYLADIRRFYNWQEKTNEQHMESIQNEIDRME